MTSIYALINPLNEHVFYIGQTVNPQSRLRGHLSCRLNEYKWSQLELIRKSGKVPEMLIIETCEDDDANRLERFYIHLFQSYGFYLNQAGALGFKALSKKGFFLFTYKPRLKKDSIECSLRLELDSNGLVLKWDFSYEEYEQLSEQAIIKLMIEDALTERPVQPLVKVFVDLNCLDKI